MKLTCEREKLLHGFQTVAGIAPSRSPKAILQNVKLEATSGHVTLVATDLEVGIRTELSGFEVEADGDVLLPIGRFGAILRESPDEKLLMESDGRKILVRGAQSEFQLPAADPDEFPTVSAFEEQVYLTLPVRFFREMIRRTVFATDTESSRYALGGILMEVSPEGITAVATDGRRLARQQGPVEVGEGYQGSENATIIPSRAMTLMERALTDNEDNVMLAARENDVLVKSQGVTIYARLVEGRFPKWRDVFPRMDDALQLEIAAGPFFAAVRQAAIVTSEDRRGVEFTFGEGRILLAGHGAERGESHVELPIAYDGAEVRVILDPRYLNDFLKVLEPDKVFTLAIKDPESAVVCTTDDGYAYVIMPLAADQQQPTS